MKNKLTAIIVSFYRTEYLEKCLKTLRTTYPHINIFVGNNGSNNDEKKEKLCLKYKAEYHKLPYDTGIGVGRNILVEKVKTPYILIGDDDFAYDSGSRVDQMLDFLEGSDFDLIGGRVFEGGRIRNYQGYIYKNDKYFQWERLNMDKFERKGNFKYKPCDITFNYFVARTEAVRRVKWDKYIKVAYEHSTFFIDFKEAGYKIAFSPDPIVTHKPPISINDRKEYERYRLFRNRKSDKKRFYTKYNLEYCIDMNGRKDFFDGTSMNEITFCITMFERFDLLKQLLSSIVKNYKYAKILIADQSKKFYAKEYKKLWQELFDQGLQIKPIAINMDYDCGLSKCRNHLINVANTPYILILEEDFIFNEKTKLEKMIDIMDADPCVGIVGGLVKENMQEVHYEHYWEIKNKSAIQISDNNAWQNLGNTRFKRTGSVLNFALARREVFFDLLWDNDIKIFGEHTDFYLRFKDTKWEVAYTDSVEIEHDKSFRDDNYKDMRQRIEFFKLVFKKHNINKIKYLNGRVRELQPDGEIKKYRA